MLIMYLGASQEHAEAKVQNADTITAGHQEFLSKALCVSALQANKMSCNWACLHQSNRCIVNRE